MIRNNPIESHRGGIVNDLIISGVYMFRNALVMNIDNSIDKLLHYHPNHHTFYFFYYIAQMQKEQVCRIIDIHTFPHTLFPTFNPTGGKTIHTKVHTYVEKMTAGGIYQRP